MTRIHDVGGMEGFGPVDPSDDLEPFHADWEARVYALNRALIRHGVYDLNEFRDAVERLDPGTYVSLGYYERWFAALENILAEKGVL
jgi:nitrile hydratase